EVNPWSSLPDAASRRVAVDARSPPPSRLAVPSATASDGRSGLPGCVIRSRQAARIIYGHALHHSFRTVRDVGSPVRAPLVETSRDRRRSQVNLELPRATSSERGHLYRMD